MNKDEAMIKAIARVKGQEYPAGTIVGTEDDPLSWELMGYDGDIALLAIDEERKRTAPKSEVFGVKKVINVANHYLNLGFWEEGMEGIMLNIGRE